MEVQTRSSADEVAEVGSVLDTVPRGLTVELARSAAINLLGTAKFKFSPAVAFQVTTPATFSSIVRRGPPLFPCEAGAVVWTQLLPFASSLNPLIMPSETE